MCVYYLCLSFSFSLSLWWWREENQKWCVFIVFRSPPHGCLLRTYLIWRWVGIFENIVSSRYKKTFSVTSVYSHIENAAIKQIPLFKQREIYDLLKSLESRLNPEKWKWHWFCKWMIIGWDGRGGVNVINDHLLTGKYLLWRWWWCFDYLK